MRNRCRSQVGQPLPGQRSEVVWSFLMQEVTVVGPDHDLIVAAAQQECVPTLRSLSTCRCRRPRSGSCVGSRSVLAERPQPDSVGSFIQCAQRSGDHRSRRAEQASLCQKVNHCGEVST